MKETVQDCLDRAADAIGQYKNSLHAGTQERSLLIQEARYWAERAKVISLQMDKPKLGLREMTPSELEDKWKMKVGDKQDIKKVGYKKGK